MHVPVTGEGCCTTTLVDVIVGASLALIPGGCCIGGLVYIDVKASGRESSFLVIAERLFC